MEFSEARLSRFMKYVTFCPNTGCWLWSGCATPRGYGRFDNQLAHRVSFAFHKHNPGTLCVCHACDVTSCVNPDHLFAGTQKDNMSDCARKKRFNRSGERNIKAKLSASDVLAIRSLQLPNAEIARLYGVRDSAISKIIKRQTWRHV